MFRRIERVTPRSEPPLTIGQYRTAIELWVAMRRLSETLAVGTFTPAVYSLEIHRVAVKIEAHV
jgi:hypothetical protein